MSTITRLMIGLRRAGLGTGRGIGTAFRTMMRYLLVIAALTLFTVTAWVAPVVGGMWLGLLVAGLSCLVLEWVVRG